MRPAPEGTQVVQRLARILKVFSAERPAWGLTEVAVSVELPKSTSHRLLVALESEGFLTYDREARVYELGPVIASLGRLAARGGDLVELSHPMLESLARRTRETCTLELLEGGRMLIVGEVAGGYLLNPAGWVGTSWPLHATSSGKAMLAGLRDSRRDELLDAPLERLTPRTITEPDALRAELERIARDGWASAVDELEIGYTAVSAAVVGPDGAPRAALSLGGPTSRFGAETRRELAALLVRTAAELSDRLREAGAV